MSEDVLIENYLFNRLEPADRLVMEAKLLLDKDLRETTDWQEKTYALVKAYSRKTLKQEIEAVHKKLFTETKFESFRNKIKQIFK